MGGAAGEAAALRALRWPRCPQSALRRVAARGAAGIIELRGGYTGVLLAQIRDGEPSKQLSMRLAMYKGS